MGRNSVHKIKRVPRYSSGSSVVHLEDEHDLFALLERTDNPLILLLEGVQDPHNLGACLRSASGAGVTALLAPQKGSCGITHTVRDVSCGGADEVPFLKIKNTSMLLRRPQPSLPSTKQVGPVKSIPYKYSPPLSEVPTI